MDPITFEQFQALDIRVGTIVAVDNFPEARKPAYKLCINLGPELGIKNSSAQVTDLYSKEQLLNQRVICICNLGPKQVGPFISEVLTTGFYNHHNQVVLAQPQQAVPDGSRLC